MDSNTAQRVISTLYDRLFDIATYRPQVIGGTAPPNNERPRTLIHLSKNQVIKEGQFANALSPSNPEGSPAEAEAFSNMVDTIPLASTQYVERAGAKISRAYTQIVNGANSNLIPDPAQVNQYKLADEYLNTFKEANFMGQIRRTPIETEVFALYKKNRQAFNSAVAKYGATLVSHDMNDPLQQQLWQTEAPVLQGEVDSAYDTWRNANADLVEEALAVKSSTMNNAVRQAILDAQTRVSQPLASSIVGGQNWLLSYANPDRWSTPELAPSFSDFTLTTSNLNSTVSTEYTSYGGGGGWGFGLWSIGGGFNSTQQSEHSHMTSDTFELNCKIGFIPVVRPWFDEFLFNLSDWSMSGVAPGGIAKGSFNDVDSCLLPMVTTGFIAARDVTVTSNFSETDHSFESSETSFSVGFGWGPFSVRGNYSHRETEEHYQAHFEGGKLIIPGIQIIGWVSSVLPLSPKI